MYSKSAITAAVIALTGASFWFPLSIIFDQPGLNGTSVSATLLILTVYLTAICMGMLFMKQRTLFLTAVLTSTVPFLILFGVGVAVVSAIALFLCASHIAFGRVQEELANRLNVRVPVLVREGLPLILTFFSLLVAVAYFTHTEVSPSPTIETLFPRTVFNRVLRATSPIIWNRILPGFDASLTVDEYITERLEASGAHVQVLPERERITVLREARTQIFGDVAHPLNGSERIDSVLYDVVISRSNSYLDPYRKLLPIGLALAFFLFLRTIAFPYGWLLTLIVWGVIRAFISWGWIVRLEEHVVKERLFWNA